jgi:hypothetical protein
LTFLLEAMTEKGAARVELPIEQAELKKIVDALHSWCESDDPDRDLQYWDVVAAAGEAYRASVRLGFGGEREDVPLNELKTILTAFRAKVRAGIQRAVEMNDGIPPTYFVYTVTDYDLITDASDQPQCGEQGRPSVRAKWFEPTVHPLFLEGPVHSLKVQPDVASARDLHARIKVSDLFDRKLKMYKVNASLEDLPHGMGRARAFAPGWRTRRFSSAAPTRTSHSTAPALWPALGGTAEFLSIGTLMMAREEPLFMEMENSAWRSNLHCLVGCLMTSER